ncbi:MAG: hypothetical protein UY05_C0018G0001 [Candidatus Peregrinibacteria bacterium GW2011_GWA2_47_7]|nr:MAG: hypothetical protein UY05_C0018G0001 [Candidatus Peregrinibacteria bacterium GW2011_GWA2_47_7]
MEIPVQIIALVEEQTSLNPIVVLHDRGADRVLPIWIGDAEARAIAVALNNIETPRPLTHMLFLSLSEKVGATIERIVIDRMEEHTYFATIYLNQGEKIHAIDARPSDAIAIALTRKVPIFVHEKVMNSAGQKNPFPHVPAGDASAGQEQGKHRKIELSKVDLERIANVLKKAQEREQKAGG